MLPKLPEMFYTRRYQGCYNRIMKITRFPQSCILIEKDAQKIVIDPGTPFLHTHKPEEIKDVAAVLYTHQHQDHYEPSIADTLFRGGTAIYANEATAQLIGGDRCKIIKDGDGFHVGGFEVRAYELPHCLLPDGSAGPQNTGYIIDDIFFHPGDGKEMQAALQVDTVALPLIGPDISVREAFAFAGQVQAKLAIPIHYDLMGANIDVYKAWADGSNLPFEFRVLADGESLEIT